MPLEKFVLIVVAVITAAGVTVGVAALMLAAPAAPGLAALVTVPGLLVAYLLVRVVSDRLRSAEDRRYDRTRR